MVSPPSASPRPATSCTLTQTKVPSLIAAQSAMTLQDVSLDILSLTFDVLWQSMVHRPISQQRVNARMAVAMQRLALIPIERVRVDLALARTSLHPLGNLASVAGKNENELRGWKCWRLCREK